MKFRRFILRYIATLLISYVSLSFTSLAPIEIIEMNHKALAYLKVPINTSVLTEAVSSSLQNYDLQGNVSSIETSRSFTEPVSIQIDKIGVSSPILNPQSRDNTLLDLALQSGIVHYPGSALLDQDANMLLFGHSSGLPVIYNQYYKVFNRLKELNLGDEIKVFSKDNVYFYKVTSISVADANEALVQFETGKRVLTLSTCDTFGKKQDRFVVKADFIKKTSLKN